MALARKKSTRSSVRKDVMNALLNENNPQILLKLYNKAKKQTRYDTLIKQLHRKFLESSMPALTTGDLGDIDLRKCWIESSVRLKQNMKTRMRTALLNKGYLQSMLDQLSVAKIGKKNFIKLAKCGAINLTAEYIIFNFYQHLLSGQQRIAIANVLQTYNAKLPKHLFLIHATNGNYSKL